ncbi:MAG: DUF1573 domain-containing protein [Muribaculaceae bacterium]|nr:DUF1573 domain-containing protein [Muribaculaceae bacterium]
MKYIIAIVWSIFLSVQAFCADDKGPLMHFVEKSYDFGTIKEENGPVSHEFEFKNTGDSPLVIISASASCGCTRPEYPIEPIRPGKSGKIKVTYNPAGRPGEFDRSIKLRTNVKGKRFVLKISGVTIPKEEKE